MKTPREVTANICQRALILRPPGGVRRIPACLPAPSPSYAALFGYSEKHEIRIFLLPGYAKDHTIATFHIPARAGCAGPMLVVAAWRPPPRRSQAEQDVPGLPAGAVPAGAAAPASALPRRFVDSRDTADTWPVPPCCALRFTVIRCNSC